MMNRDQLRAARILLHLDQRELAALARVNVVTVRRLEGGEEVGRTEHDRIRDAVQEAGAILIEADGGLGGARIQRGVALRPLEDCSEATRERLARGDFGRRREGVQEGGRAARAREKLSRKTAADDATGEA